MFRLIEHEISFETHFALRIGEYPYTSEFSPQEYALGHPLPIIIHKNVIYSGEHLKNFLKYLIFSNYAWEMNEKIFYDIDTLVSGEIYKNLFSVFNQLIRINGEREDMLKNNLPTFASFISTKLNYFKNTFVSNCNDPYPNATEFQLISFLKKQLFEIERSIIDCKQGGRNFSVSSEYVISDKWRSLTADSNHNGRLLFSDALLFGFLAKISMYKVGNELMTEKLKEYLDENIKKFFPFEISKNVNLKNLTAVLSIVNNPLYNKESNLIMNVKENYDAISAIKVEDDDIVINDTSTIYYPPALYVSQKSFWKYIITQEDQNKDNTNNASFSLNEIDLEKGLEKINRSIKTPNITRVTPNGILFLSAVGISFILHFLKK